MKYLMQLSKDTTTTTSEMFPKITVFTEINNFGDQQLTFRKEELDGSVSTYYAYFQENSHVTSRKGLLNVYKRVSK